MRNMTKPHKIIMIGPARATIFMNTVFKDGEEIVMPKVAFEIRFKDRYGKWRGTSSISMAELPKAILALEKAQAFLLDKKSLEDGDNSGWTES